MIYKYKYYSPTIHMLHSSYKSAKSSRDRRRSLIQRKRNASTSNAGTKLKRLQLSPRQMEGILNY